MEYAKSLKENPRSGTLRIKNPAVIGATLDLGHCLDLTDFHNLCLLKTAYQILTKTYNKSGFSIPENKSLKNSNDLLIRELDCAVIETIHKILEEKGMENFDSVKGVFWEGDELYPNAGIKEKNHVQICIRNPNCMKGLFIPRIENTKYKKV